METTTKIDFALLGGGCFWCLEAGYEVLPGVTGVTSGYAGGGARVAELRRRLLGRDRSRRGRPRGLRPREDLLRGDTRAVLEDPRSHYLEQAGRRRGHAVPLGHILRRRGAKKAAAASMAAQAARRERPSSPSSCRHRDSGRPRTITRAISEITRTQATAAP